MLENKDFVEHILHQQKLLGLPDTRPVNWAVENLSGNINRVRRVRLDYAHNSAFSFVVKHLPEGGYLEKYPGITFPESRLRFESQWLKLCSETNPCAEVKAPKLLCHDEAFHTLVLEDLGNMPSYADSVSNCSPAITENLGAFLGAFHGKNLGAKDIANPAAAQNRPYVLTYPLANGKTVRQIWREQCTRPELLDELILLQDWFTNEYSTTLLPILELMDRKFKTSGISTLTHGDLHGDSILVLDSHRLGILDAELCDTGTPAFDTGTLIGHIWGNMLATNAPTQAILSTILLFMNNYERSLKENSCLDADDITTLREDSFRYTGAEILRRTLGAAPFRCLRSIRNKKALLMIAKTLLSNPKSIIAKITESDLAPVD